MVSSEISSAIHQIIVNGAALLACSRSENPSLSVSGQFEGTASKYTEIGIPVASTSSIMNKSDGLKVSESDLKFDFGELDGKFESTTPICFDMVYICVYIYNSYIIVI